MSVDFIIQSKCKDTLKDLAKLALNNRLYVAGWELSYQLQKIIKESEYYFDNNYKIYLYYKDDKPVSIFLYAPLYDSRDNCMAFTRKSERRNRYNTALIKSFKNDNPDIILKKYYFGISRSAAINLFLREYLNQEVIQDLNRSGFSTHNRHIYRGLYNIVHSKFYVST